MCPVIFQAPCKLYPGPVFIKVYLEVGESLIVFESDVIVGTVPLYQVTLKYECFLVCIGNKELKIADLSYHPLLFQW